MDLEGVSEHVWPRGVGRVSGYILEVVGWGMKLPNVSLIRGNDSPTPIGYSPWSASWCASVCSREKKWKRATPPSAPKRRHLTSSSSSRADEEEKRRRWHRACISTHTGVEGERSFAAQSSGPQKRNAKNHCLSLSLFQSSPHPHPPEKEREAKEGDKRKKAKSEEAKRRAKRRISSTAHHLLPSRRLSTPHHHHRVRAKRPGEQHDNTEQGFEEDDGR